MKKAILSLLLLVGIAGGAWAHDSWGVYYGGYYPTYSYYYDPCYGYRYTGPYYGGAYYTSPGFGFSYYHR